jgi:hypothetical protein
MSDAGLLFDGCSVVVEGGAPNGSGQREATTADEGFASNPPDPTAPLNCATAAGAAVFGASSRLVCGGSSARASARECCGTGFAAGEGGFAAGKMF